MKIKIEPLKIKDNPANQVTSHKLFENRKIKDGDRYLFHEEGIFSEKIFGKFNHCYCGKLTKPGYCEECGCRVISRRHLPNYYIEFEFDLPNRSINYGDYDEELVYNLMNYIGFLYDGQYIEYDTTTINNYNSDLILYGKDALLSIGVSEDWYNANVHKKVSIPHTSYRQITFKDDNYILGTLNTVYMEMLKLNNKYSRLVSTGKLNKYSELNLKHLVCSKLNDLYDELFMILAKNHINIIDRELKGQPETGMIRAVMTNNFNLDENTLKIGYYFIPTLYPFLLEKYTDEEGTDIEGINQELREGEYYVLFNRQPTIGIKSIIAMIPEFSYEDDEMFVIQANPIVYDGLAADVDGDVLNVIALYSKEANEEAKKLLAGNNYIEGSNSTIRNSILEEFDYVKTQIQ